MQKVYDFHTHILPGLDDGSRSIQESLAMVDALTRQGGCGIVATSHFYANRSSPEQFLHRRTAAWERLRPHLQPDAPEIRMGAEVQYFEGIHHYDRLEQFCIEGTGLLLVEMPLCRWTKRMIAAILEINAREGITVLLAHIERYLPYRNQKALNALREQGVLMQASAEFFIKKGRAAVKLLRKGKIHFLGSDAHNMDTRKPNLERALQRICKKKGARLLRMLSQREATVLHGTPRPREEDTGEAMLRQEI